MQFTGESMRHLSFLERVFLRRLVESGGEIEVDGNYDHQEWDKLVEDGLVESHAAGIDTNAYAITEKGRSSLTGK